MKSKQAKYSDNFNNQSKAAIVISRCKEESIYQASIKWTEHQSQWTTHLDPLW